MRKNYIWLATMVLWTVFVMLLGAGILNTEVAHALEQGSVDQETADRLAEKYGLSRETEAHVPKVSVDWGISFGGELISFYGAASVVRLLTHPMVFLVQMWL